MSAPQTPKSPVPLVVFIVALGGAAALAYFVKDPAILAGSALVAAAAGAGALFAFPPRKSAPERRQVGQAEITPLLRGVTDSRNELINAMAILQQEIRLLQDAAAGAADTRPLRDDLHRIASEIAALKAAINSATAQAKAAETLPPKVTGTATRVPFTPPAADEDEGDFDVAPLSFDDEDEKPVAKTPAPAAKVVEKPSPIFVPEAEPVLEAGLEPEDMEDDGDWLTGGLEEEDLIVSKKVDFEAIVQKDAARPKPVVDEEEQRVLREEMAQMADEDDWVGAGLEDRDVKVKKTTANDELFDKLRAEIEAKRVAKESTVGVRAPARGETALLVNITVPHGTKLFVRGVGPGLDVEKGAAMQQAGHGKWQWICPEQGKPCVVTVWENDDLQSEGNPIRIPGGFALTVTPTFRRKLKL